MVRFASIRFGFEETKPPENLWCCRVGEVRVALNEHVFPLPCFSGLFFPTVESIWFKFNLRQLLGLHRRHNLVLEIVWVNVLVMLSFRRLKPRACFSNIFGNENLRFLLFVSENVYRCVFA